MSDTYSEIQIQNGCSAVMWRRGLRGWLGYYLRHGLLMTYNESWWKFIDQVVSERLHEHTLVRLHRTGVSITCSSTGTLRGTVRQKAYIATNRRFQRGVWEAMIVGPLSYWLMSVYGPVSASVGPAELFAGRMPQRELDVCERTYQRASTNELDRLIQRLGSMLPADEKEGLILSLSDGSIQIYTEDAPQDGIVLRWGVLNPTLTPPTLPNL
jgi:hypothetical protein